MVIVMMAGTAAEHAVLGSQLPNSESGDVAALELCHPLLEVGLPGDQQSILDAGVREAYARACECREEIAAVANCLMMKDDLTHCEVATIVVSVRTQRA